MCVDLKIKNAVRDNTTLMINLCLILGEHMIWASKFPRAQAKFWTSIFLSSNMMYLFMWKLFSRIPNLNYCCPWNVWCRTWVYQRREKYEIRTNSFWPRGRTICILQASALLPTSLETVRYILLLEYNGCWSFVIWKHLNSSLGHKTYQVIILSSLCSPQIILSHSGTENHC